MLSESLEPDAASWRRFVDRFAQAQKDSISLPGHWQYRPNMDVPYEQAEEDWLKHCERHRAEIDRLVDRWLEDGTVHTDDSELRYFLGARFAIAYELVSLLSFPAEDYDNRWMTVFPFPPLSPNVVLRQLLVEWWLGIGQFRAFERLYNYARRQQSAEPYIKRSPEHD